MMDCASTQIFSPEELADSEALQREKDKKLEIKYRKEEFWQRFRNGAMKILLVAASLLFIVALGNLFFGH